MQNKTRNHDTAVIGAIRFSVSTSLRLPRSCCLNLSGNPASLVPAASPGLSPGCFPSSASSLINAGCSHHIPLTPAGDASPAGKQSIPFSPSQQKFIKNHPGSMKTGSSKCRRRLQAELQQWPMFWRCSPMQKTWHQPSVLTLHGRARRSRCK